ncbi:MAG TPA: ABC transporter permease, partial [Flavilitoribacter sp.]|nr:ABC transporter permease [Flavilitoribacter sp.]
MDRFLEWYCADELLEEIQGDLYEAYRDRSAESGITYARRRYFLDVLRFFRLSNIHPRLYTINTFSMFRNHLKIALRNFKKYKVDSSINLLGLVLGVASCLLIGLYVLEETSYDNFHPAGDRTYRLVMNMYENSELTVISAPIYPAVGPALLQEFPEVEAYTRILPFGGGVYSRRDEDGSLVRYNEDKAVMADGSFFDLFGFRLLRGDKDQALAGKNQIVLSESTARKYFGNEDPIGKILVRRGQEEMTVTGVMADFPRNSHMQFDMIYSLASLDGF